jgi:Tol biopolymer transport system component
MAGLANRLRTPGSLVLAAVLAGCSGGSGPAPAEPPPTPRGDFQDPSRAQVTARNAPVPAPAAGEALVFLRAGSLWLMRPGAEAEAVQLTVRSHESPDEAPALSPDGRRVAWATAGDDGVFRIHLMDLDEMIPRPLTDGGDGGDTEPTWSPDGARIAFVRGDPRDRRDLYVVSAAGGEPTLLLEGDDDEPDHTGFPAWSPDGALIAFSADRRANDGTALWLLEVDSRRLRRLTAPRPNARHLRDHAPAWSPDGRTVAFASNRHVASADDATDLDIYTVATDGSGLTRLTSDPGVASQPAYSPDGKRLYFSSSRDRANPYEMELYVMAAGGGKQRRLTRDERPQNSAPSAGVIE